MLNLKRYRGAPSQLADILPWAMLVAPGVVLNKQGNFQCTMRYRGPDLESATPSQLVSMAARWNNILKRLPAGWAVFMEVERKASISYPDSCFDDVASWFIDSERRRSFEASGSHYENVYYLTVTYLPPIDTITKTSEVFYKQPAEGDGRGAYLKHLENFQIEVERLFAALTAIMPELHRLNSEQTLTYLHGRISNKKHVVRVPLNPAYLDEFLADTPLIGGENPKLGNQHIQTVTIRGFPNSTEPGILHELNKLGFSYHWVSRWIPLDKLEAEKVLKRIRRQWFQKRKSAWTLIQEFLFKTESPLINPDAETNAGDAEEALDVLGSDDAGYGYITTTVSVFHEDPQIAKEQILQVEQTINSQGFVVIRETLNAVEAFLGSLPGEVNANIRQPIINTMNFCHMAPLEDIWPGAAKNKHLNGPPLLVAKTKETTPFRFCHHVGDVGHMMVLGPTGAGKSVLLSLLALQFRRYQDNQIIFFDKGRNARAAVLAMGGASFDLSPEGDVCFQPLANIDNSITNVSYANDWILDLLALESVEVTPDIKKEVWEALLNLQGTPKEQRTLTGLTHLLQSEKLRNALHPYTLEGPLGYLLDASSDLTADNTVLHFEMEQLLHNKKAAVPVLSYLFQKLEERFDGRPTLLVLDEAWVFFDNPLFADRIRDWLKTLRKKNVSVVFATQSLSDIAQSSISTALIESCPSRIFLPNGRAQEPQIYAIYEQFGLNDRQIQIISQAQPKKDYYLQQDTVGNRLFELGLDPAALALCGAGSMEDQVLINNILKNTSGNFLINFLRAKGLHDQASIIERTLLNSQPVQHPVIQEEYA